MTSAPLGSYRRRLGYAAPPWGIDLLLTDACNLRCTYCPIWGENSALPAPAAFMDTGGALRLIDSVAGFHPMIRLFGGEPFLHPEWPRIVAAIRAHGLHCTGKAMPSSILAAVSIPVSPSTWETCSRSLSCSSGTDHVFAPSAA